MLYDGTMVIEQLRVWKIYTLLSGVSLLILIFCLCVCVFFFLFICLGYTFVLLRCSWYKRESWVVLLILEDLLSEKLSLIYIWFQGF